MGNWALGQENFLSNEEKKKYLGGEQELPLRFGNTKQT